MKDVTDCTPNLDLHPADIKCFEECEECSALHMASAREEIKKESLWKPSELHSDRSAGASTREAVPSTQNRCVDGCLNSLRHKNSAIKAQRHAKLKYMSGNEHFLRHQCQADVGSN